MHVGPVLAPITRMLGSYQRMNETLVVSDTLCARWKFQLGTKASREADNTAVSLAGQIRLR